MDITLLPPKVYYYIFYLNNRQCKRTYSPFSNLILIVDTRVKLPSQINFTYGLPLPLPLLPLFWLPLPLPLLSLFWLPLPFSTFGGLPLLSTKDWTDT